MKPQDHLVMSHREAQGRPGRRKAGRPDSADRPDQDREEGSGPDQPAGGTAPRRTGPESLPDATAG